MPTIKACIFDLDGVIVETAQYHFLAWRRLANELGFDFDESQNAELKGVSREKSLEIILGFGGKQLSDEEKISWAAKKNDWYQDYIKGLTQDDMLAGVLDFLNYLRKQEIKIGLGSASRNAPTILAALNITDYFDVIIDGNKTTKGKPHPQVFLMGSEVLGVTPSECIVFEDAQKGIEAANAGGFWSVAIDPNDELKEANFKLKGFEDISWDSLLSNLKN